MNVEINLDELKYEGKTRSERRLNRELLETILELNMYQDSYDHMRTIDEIKERINIRKQLLSEEYIPKDDRQKYQCEIETLEWVLNSSKSFDEKLSELESPSKEEVIKIVNRLNEKYKQMTIDDFL